MFAKRKWLNFTKTSYKKEKMTAFGGKNPSS
jgi:hypothetical protein